MTFEVHHQKKWWFKCLAVGCRDYNKTTHPIMICFSKVILFTFLCTAQ